VSVTPVTLDVPYRVFIAIYAGVASGVPANISTDSDDRYMLWDGWAGRAGLLGEGGFFTSRTYDLHGQRIARHDGEAINFVVRADSASALNVYVFSRVLVLKP